MEKRGIISVPSKLLGLKKSITINKYTYLSIVIDKYLHYSSC